MAEIKRMGAFYLYRTKNSPFWYVRAEAAPRAPLFKSTGEENETLAARQAKILYSDWSQDKELKTEEKVLFRDLLSDYIETQATFLKSGTMIRLESVSKLYLIPAFGNRFISEIQALWPKFVRDQKRVRPDSSLFNERKYLLGALKYDYNLYLIDRVPPLATVKGKKSVFHVFTDSEIEKLLKNASPKLRMHILFAYLMGLRHGEIARIQMSDIDLIEGTLHVRGTKTDKSDRVIALNKDLMKGLKGQIEAVGGRSKFLFPQVHNMGRPEDQRVADGEWQTIKNTLGIIGRFHDLRHSCATKIAESVVPAEIACAYLGMSLRIYDRVYCHLGKQHTKAAAGVVRLPSSRELGRKQNDKSPL